MSLNRHKCQVLARLIADRDPSTYVRGTMIKRRHGSGTVHFLRQCLKDEGLESVVVDLGHYNPDHTVERSPDETYAKRIFNELYVHNDKVIIMYLNPKFTADQLSLTVAVLKSAVDPVYVGKMHWNNANDRVSFTLDMPMMFIVEDHDDFAPVLRDRCLFVDVGI